MTELSVELHVAPKWWMRPALWIVGALSALGIISIERGGRWLANYAFIIEAKRIGGDPEYDARLPVRLNVSKAADRALLRRIPPFDILLNDEPQQDVTAFDTEAGWLTRHLRNAKGERLVDWERGVVLTETVQGKVEVQWQ